MSAPPTIVWFRQDLRLADNPALAEAAAAGPVVPVYVWAPDEEGDWPPGAASRWWLHHSLAALDHDLRERGSRLVIRRGPSVAALEELARETGAGAVHWNRRYEPAAIARDTGARRRLPGARSFNAALLHEPWTVHTRSGGPFRVFTPFWRACRAVGDPEQAGPAPRRLDPPPRWPRSDALAELGLLPDVDWAGGLAEAWTPGEAGARAALRAFAGRVSRYAEDRDVPARPTSRLSPHLHFGEIGPRQVWDAVGDRAGAAAYRRQLGWREFAHHLLYHFPQTPAEALRPGWGAMPWRDDPDGLEAWQRGRTGAELVDAGMRELWQTGFMHNRARMVAASFLVKDLLVDWRAGARWFWDTLVDADLADNTLGWQWVAGCGADAAPFFRIFNPDTQARRHDADRAYRGRWLGDGPRPDPIVDHAAARERALAAHREVVAAAS